MTGAKLESFGDDRSIDWPQTDRIGITNRIRMGSQGTGSTPHERRPGITPARLVRFSPLLHSRLRYRCRAAAGLLFRGVAGLKVLLLCGLAVGEFGLSFTDNTCRSRPRPDGRRVLGLGPWSREEWRRGGHRDDASDALDSLRGDDADPEQCSRRKRGQRLVGFFQMRVGSTAGKSRKLIAKRQTVGDDSQHLNFKMQEKMGQRSQARTISIRRGAEAGRDEEGDG